MASAFGKRLKLARELAGLTQPALAAKVPMAQSTLASAEASGDGSRLTPQLAHHCGVNAYWLATGEGAMLAAAAPVGMAVEAGTALALRGHQVPSLAIALPVVLAALRSLPRERRSALAADWAALLSAPDSVELREAVIAALSTPAPVVVEIAQPEQTKQRFGGQ